MRAAAVSLAVFALALAVPVASGEQSLLVVRQSSNLQVALSLDWPSGTRDAWRVWVPSEAQDVLYGYEFANGTITRQDLAEAGELIQQEDPWTLWEIEPPARAPEFPGQALKLMLLYRAPGPTIEYRAVANETMDLYATLAIGEDLQARRAGFDVPLTLDRVGGAALLMSTPPERPVELESGEVLAMTIADYGERTPPKIAAGHLGLGALLGAAAGFWPMRKRSQ